MGYNYTTMFPFERNFDPVPSTVWMKANWVHSITLSVLYMIIIYVGERLMLSRKPYSLDKILTVWNGVLAVFSFIGMLRMSPEFFHTLYNYGFTYSICTMSFSETVTGFWTQMFGMSKAFELIDTLFIVLRKRPLIFLHWYHHITVLIYTWHAYKDHTAAGRWFIWMNYTVHAFMYTYYTFRSLGFHPSKWIPMTVTTMQISQMIMGCVIAISAYRLKTNGVRCQQTYENLYFSFMIYFSYFLLFARFFYYAYVKKGNKYVGGEEKSSKTTKKVQ